MKGGEKVNIEALQFMNFVPSNGKLGQVNQQSGENKNTFGALLNSQNEMSSLNEENSAQNVMDLLNNILFLLKGGSGEETTRFDILNESTITENKIAEEMGVTEDEWKKKFSLLMDEILSLMGNNPIQDEKLTSIKKLISDGQLLKGTTELFALLSKLPKDLLKQMKPDLFQFAANTANTVENLLKQMDFSNHDLKDYSNFKESIETMISKLEQMIDNGSASNKKMILQNAFNRLLVEKQEKVTVPSVNTENEINKQPVTGPIHVQQVSKIEQLVLHINKDSKTVDYQQFVKDFSNILGKSQFLKGEGTNKLLIKLYPEHLGSLRIEILQDKGSLTARMFATSGAAKEILDSQIHQLKNAFTQQNIQVDKIDVIYGEAEAQKFDREQSEQQSFKQEQQQNSKQEIEEENPVQFVDVLNEHLLEEKI